MNTIKAIVHKAEKHKLTSEIDIVRSLPNSHSKAIGSVILLDHVVEKTYNPKTKEMPNGSFAHPHRGIATFTYLLDGGVHHLDSNGGEGKVYAGGIQWMNSGNGIIHDEFLPYDLQEKGGTFHALQFWLNLPAKNTAEKPDYMAIQANDVPEVILPNQVGLVRILLGKYQNKESIVPNFLEQFMYHITLNAEKSIELPTNQKWEYGIYVINGEVKIDDEIDVSRKEVAELSEFGERIKISNETNEALDIMVFAGERYTEPMVSHGPFIMNNQNEIAKAYSDYQSGKYGYIDYSKVKL
jgi:redox-sensitive bicupin YhaK (pirin superfamily)